MCLRARLTRARSAAEADPGYPTDRVVFLTAFELGNHLLYDLGDMNGAIGVYCTALEAQQRSCLDGEGVAESLEHLGRALSMSGDDDAAIRAHEEAIGLRRAAGQAGLPIAQALSTLGDLAMKKGDGTRATKFYTETAQMCVHAQPQEEAQALRGYALNQLKWVPKPKGTTAKS